MDTQLDRETIEQMREMVAKHDRARKPMEFDLSKPPTPPYTFQKFPMLVYKHDGAVPAHNEKVMPVGAQPGTKPEIVHIPASYMTKKVNSEAELEAALADGWLEKPPVFSPEAEEIAAEVVAEGFSNPFKRRGRPPKVQAEE